MASVVIATRNRAPLVATAIQSVLAQTLPGVETIVVDDGSTDETPAALSRYRERVRIARQPRRGLAAARNRGLDTARGEYLAFLDDDDVYEPRKLEEQVTALERQPELGWNFCDVLIEAAGETRSTVSRRFRYADRRLAGWLFPELVHGNFIPAIAPVIRRSALDAAGRFDETLTALEDWDLWLRLSLVARASYVPRPLARYRLQADAMSRDRALMDENRFLVLDKLVRTRRDALRALGPRGRRLVANTHNWFGYQAHARGDWPEAVRRLGASVRCLPIQGRASVMLAIAVGRRWLG